MKWILAAVAAIALAIIVAVNTQPEPSGGVGPYSEARCEEAFEKVQEAAAAHRPDALNSMIAGHCLQD